MGAVAIELMLRMHGMSQWIMWEMSDRLNYGNASLVDLLNSWVN